MSKDVFYIEPEDDITDVISRLKTATEKIVALVLPKVPEVFQSTINIKLIAKSAAELEKIVVLVTSDAVVLKNAAEAHLPVTPDLQTRPVIPSNLTIHSPDDEEDPDQSASEIAAEEEIVAAPEPERPNETEAVADVAKTEKPKSKLAIKIPNFEKNRKWIIAGTCTVLGLAIFLVWALVFAPSVSISAAIRTTSNNFNSNVTFTTATSEENFTLDKLLLDERKLERTQDFEFAATGEEDRGEKAKGELKVSVNFANTNSVEVPAGAIFTFNSQKYISDSAVAVNWDGATFSECENDVANAYDFSAKGCTKTVSVAVSAIEPGEKYNIAAATLGWTSSIGDVKVISSSDMKGGTTRLVKIVQQSDVDKAKADLIAAVSADLKSEISENSNENSNFITIGDSFAVVVDSAEPTPKIGEEVKEGTTPVISAKMTATIFSVDADRIQGYVSQKAIIGSDQKIYSFGEPFVEHFIKNGDIYTGKLKTKYEVGPEVTEDAILEKVLGRKLGDVQYLLKSINGVSSVKVRGSFFWVNSVPNDPEKVKVDLTMEK